MSKFTLLDHCISLNTHRHLIRRHMSYTSYTCILYSTVQDRTKMKIAVSGPANDLGILGLVTAVLSG